MTWWLIGKEIWEVFTDLRGAVGMFMFILEEAIQTAGMATWIFYKEGMLDDAKENEQWIKNNLAIPLKEFAESPSGYLAYPLNEAYKTFAEVAIRKADQFQKLSGKE